MIGIISMLFSILVMLIQIVFCIVGLIIAIPLIFAISLICCIVSGIILWAVTNTITKWMGIDLDDTLIRWLVIAADKVGDWWDKKISKNKNNKNYCG